MSKQLKSFLRGCFSAEKLLKPAKYKYFLIGRFYLPKLALRIKLKNIQESFNMPCFAFPRETSPNTVGCETRVKFSIFFCVAWLPQSARKASTSGCANVRSGALSPSPAVTLSMSFIKKQQKRCFVTGSSLFGN